MATYNFLNFGMIAEDRNKRNTRVKSLTWDELSDYFTDAIESDDRLIIETEARKGTDFPLEARMLVKNAICPLGEHPQRKKPVLSVPCKDKAQGKKQLVEFVSAFKEDKSIQRSVAKWLSKTKIRFDKDTIPADLLKESA